MDIFYGREHTPTAMVIKYSSSIFGSILIAPVVVFSSEELMGGDDVTFKGEAKI